MRGIHPFIVGNVGIVLIIGIVAMAWDAGLAVFGVAIPAAGALVSCLICWWWPGFDATWWKLLPAAVLTTP